MVMMSNSAWNVRWLLLLLLLLFLGLVGLRCRGCWGNVLGCQAGVGQTPCQDGMWKGRCLALNDHHCRVLLQLRWGDDGSRSRLLLLLLCLLWDLRVLQEAELLLLLSCRRLLKLQINRTRLHPKSIRRLLPASHVLNILMGSSL